VGAADFNSRLIRVKKKTKVKKWSALKNGVGYESNRVYRRPCKGAVNPV
jgi:hypothetical protein